MNDPIPSYIGRSSYIDRLRASGKEVRLRAGYCLQVGFWVVFDEPDPDTGGIEPEGFFVDFKRAETFGQEAAFRKNHLEPAWIYV